MLRLGSLLRMRILVTQEDGMMNSKCYGMFLTLLFLCTY